jgi:multidrug efflux system membrane fusion protein
MKRTLRILLPIIILAAGVLLAVVMIKARPQIKPEPREELLPLVRVAAVLPQPHRFTVSAQGTVTPGIEINLVTEVPGKVIHIAPPFAAGGFFAAGETLVRIDPRDYELALARAKAQLAETEVRLLRERAEGEVARNEWELLGGKGEPSPLLRRQPQLIEAQAAVDSAQAAVRQAELDLERCQIKAPFAGRVWSKRIDVGQFLVRGETVARIYSVDFAEVRLPLALDDLAFLELPLAFQASPGEGPEVRLFSTIAGRPAEWRGRIVRTEAEIDPRTRMIHAVARIDQPYQATSEQRSPLAVGLFVQAEIRGRTVPHAFIVPRASLRGRDLLMVVDTEDRLRLRPVHLLRSETERAILKSGIAPGDRVCLTPLDTPVDGMRVRVVDAPEAAGQPLSSTGHE